MILFCLTHVILHLVPGATGSFNANMIGNELFSRKEGQRLDSIDFVYTDLVTGLKVLLDIQRESSSIFGELVGQNARRTLRETRHMPCARGSCMVHTNQILASVRSYKLWINDESDPPQEYHMVFGFNRRAAHGVRGIAFQPTPEGLAAVDGERLMDRCPNALYTQVSPDGIQTGMWQIPAEIGGVEVEARFSTAPQPIELPTPVWDRFQAILTRAGVTAFDAEQLGNGLVIDKCRATKFPRITFTIEGRSYTIHPRQYLYSSTELDAAGLCYMDVRPWSGTTKSRDDKPVIVLGPAFLRTQAIYFANEMIAICGPL
jgi:hypothetical protein